MSEAENVIQNSQMLASHFHPIIQSWFFERFREPTEPQRRGWPEIARGRNTLIAAPTGSGKTLTAFLVCIDRILRGAIDGQLPDQTLVVYVSPLKALSNDIQRNLQTPLAEICQRLREAGQTHCEIRVAVRTGDTPARERQAMLRRPPHILVTTPESLYLLLTSEKSRQILTSVETVIVDEIHALARDKRGSHLTLSLARLDALCEKPPVRIGLSATQRPIEDIARFLVGNANVDAQGRARCSVIDIGHARNLDLAIEVPPSELEAVCSNQQWAQIYEKLTGLIQSHRSTLVFVNTRRLAERIAHHLIGLLGEEAVASHHGSLSRQIRQSAENRLKAGSLKAIVATASLEMGIDIGFIDLVCQVGSPRSIATFLQRVGRSGHSIGAVPCGRLFPLTRDELIECMALVRSVRNGHLDSIEIPDCPLDILAQQIVAAAACEPWDEEALFQLCRTAWPYRNLTRWSFDEVVKILSQGVAPRMPRGRALHRDAINGRLRARRGARLTAITSGGAIPETAQYRVLAEPDDTFVGQLDEDFAIESQAGDIFLLGNTSWQIRQVRRGDVMVRDAKGAPPTVPFWFGEAPGRTIELSSAISDLREQISQLLTASSTDPTPPFEQARTTGTPNDDIPSSVIDFVSAECAVDRFAAEQGVRYVEAQQAALGLVPTNRQIVFERFFDESGGMQLVIHSPMGARINRAWGLALRKRFCRSFDFELQAAATDDGIVLSIGPQHSFPIESLFRMLSSDNGTDLLRQAVLAVPMFQVRWRWNLNRALVVLRQRGGKKVPPYLQRFQSDDVMAAVFPETVGCLENHHGDISIPDHPLVSQTMHDCLHEAMDVTRWLELLDDVREGRVELVARETREPSPFCHELLNANPYAFLDDAPLEERRTRAVTTRRGLSVEQLRDLGHLDPEAIAQVVQEAQPYVRDADELHETLQNLVVLTQAETSQWQGWIDELIGAGRATLLQRENAPSVWIAAERWPVVKAIWKDAQAVPPVTLPTELDVSWESAPAVVELLRGQMAVAGPTSVGSLSEKLNLPHSRIGSALEALEGEGFVLRGHFSSENHDSNADSEVQWCDRRLLARIHRLTLDGLRRQIRPVEPEQYMRFLAELHGVGSGNDWGGAAGVREVIEMLQGCELAAGAWESHVLPARLRQYDSTWLDQLFMGGEVMWGRLSPPRRSDNGRSNTILTGNVPISLVLREDLSWMLPMGREPSELNGNSNAQLVHEALKSHGALFLQELRGVTELLDGYVEDALRQLAGGGHVTSDAFASIRRLIDRRGHQQLPSRVRRQRKKRPLQPLGRWTCFPGLIPEPTNKEYLEKWCRQLLRRWGIVFRDVMLREAVAPPWHQLVPTLRAMERRGEIRGGRFISGVSGEQYATSDAVQQLRKAAETDNPVTWLAISAADPLNLIGIIWRDEARLPATRSNSLILQNGQCVATRQAGQDFFRQEQDTATAVEMSRALRLGRRWEKVDITAERRGDQEMTSGALRPANRE